MGCRCSPASTPPTARGCRTVTDWIVDGSYQFGSGLTIANRAGAGFMAAPADGGDPAYLFGSMPIEAVEPRGNWDVLGLRGTQSVDYTVSGARIPDHQTFDFFSPGGAPRARPMHHLGVLPLTAVGHAAWALGVTRRVLDELQLAVGPGPHGGGLVARRLRALLDLLRPHGVPVPGRSGLGVRGVRAGRGGGRGHGGAPLGPHGQPRPPGVRARQPGRCRDRREAYLLAGTVALRDGGVQRAFRDLHAGAQHFFASNAATIDLARSLLATP